MRIDRRWSVAMAILFLPLLVVGNAYGETKYRWDIVNLTLVGTTPNINAGGMASARAQDDSMITITGSGTFTVGDDDVSGGGTWKTFAPDGTSDRKGGLPRDTARALRSGAGTPDECLARQYRRRHLDRQSSRAGDSSSRLRRWQQRNPCGQLSSEWQSAAPGARCSARVHIRGDHGIQGFCGLLEPRGPDGVPGYCQRESHALPHSFRGLAAGFGGTDLVGNDKDGRSADDPAWWAICPPRPCV